MNEQQMSEQDYFAEENRKKIERALYTVRVLFRDNYIMSDETRLEMEHCVDVLDEMASVISQK